jgi:hypothetical protein
MMHAVPTRSVLRKSVLVDAALVACILGAFIAYVAPSLGQPLLERHGFRQTQTAYTARIYHEQGIDLLHPKLPVLGEPFEIPFEFPLFQAAAATVMAAGVDDDPAMRTTGLACFVLTALLLYGLVRHVAGRASALAALAAFVLTPFSFIWARASLIEYLATSGAVGFAWATILWRERGRPLPGALALVAGLVGLLVKPTTAVFWIVPALAYQPEGHVGTSDRRKQLGTALLVALPLAAAFAWTRHADAIKAANETTAWLVSTELHAWNFGSLSQRLDPHTWEVIVGRRLVPTVLGLGWILMLVVSVMATARAHQRRFWLGMWFAAVAPILVFTNLHFRHDYYLAAVTPALASLAGLGAGFLWARLSSAAPVLRAAAVGLALVLVLGTIELSRGYWSLIDEAKDSRVLELARELDGLTSSDELVAVAAYDWDPTLLYYARRWGETVTDRDETLGYARVRDGNYRYLFVVEPDELDPKRLKRWPWVGSLGPHSYALGNAPGELRGAEFATTSSLPQDTGTPLRRDLRVPCGKPFRITGGAQGTWLRSRIRSTTTLSLPEHALAPLPVREAAFIARSLASEGGEIVVTCAGRSAIVVEVVDAQGTTTG